MNKKMGFLFLIFYCLLSPFVHSAITDAQTHSHGITDKTGKMIMGDFKVLRVASCKQSVCLKNCEDKEDECVKNGNTDSACAIAKKQCMESCMNDCDDDL